MGSYITKNPNPPAVTSPVRVDIFAKNCTEFIEKIAKIQKAIGQPVIANYDGYDLCYDGIENVYGLIGKLIAAQTVEEALDNFSINIAAEKPKKPTA
jgi:hypothetical protein